MISSKLGHGKRKVSTIFLHEICFYAFETGLSWWNSVSSECFLYNLEFPIDQTNISNNRHHKPGGWLEFQCIQGVLSCDDGTYPQKSQFREYDRLLRAAAS